MDLPSAKIGLWSIRLALLGLWTTMHALLGLWSLSSSSPGLGSITASLSDHQVSLRPTHAFQCNTTVTHAVSPPAVCLLTRGSHCIAFRFMNASENIGCCAGFLRIASCIREMPLVKMIATTLGHCPFASRNCHPFLDHVFGVEPIGNDGSAFLSSSGSV